MCSDCRHLSQWPPPETDTYLQSLLHRLLGLVYDSRFKLTPSELCELSAFSSKTAATVLKSSYLQALSPFCFINTTTYTVEVFCDGTFLLFYDSCEFTNITFPSVPFTCTDENERRLERRCHQSTYMFSSPIMQNAERILTISVIMLVCLGSIARARSSRLRSSPKILCSPYCERDND